jgi:hypothetical protein
MYEKTTEGTYRRVGDGEMYSRMSIFFVTFDFVLVRSSLHTLYPIPHLRFFSTSLFSFA